MSMNRRWRKTFAKLCLAAAVTLATKTLAAGIVPSGLSVGGAASSSPLSTNIIYVDPNGSDATATGAAGKPFQSLTAAFALANTEAAAGTLGTVFIDTVGTFFIGTINTKGAQIDVPNGWGLEGMSSGAQIPPNVNAENWSPVGATVITFQGGPGIAISLAGNAVVKNIALCSLDFPSSIQIPIGYSSTYSSNSFTGTADWDISDINVAGASDGVYINATTSTLTLTVTGSHISTQYDTVALFGNNQNDYAYLSGDTFIANYTYETQQRIFNIDPSSNTTGTTSVAVVGSSMWVNGKSSGSINCNLASLNGATISFNNCDYHYTGSRTGAHTVLGNSAANSTATFGPGCTYDPSNFSNVTVYGSQPEIIGTGFPTATTNANLGSTATIALGANSTDTGGQITMTCGGTGIASGVIGTLTFAAPRLTSYPIISPTNASAITAINTDGLYLSASGTTAFFLNVTTGLTTNTTYTFNYANTGP
jgi:hypothetical protein